jgi:hypothetical protein
VLKPHARCEVFREFALDIEKVQDITLMLAIDDGGEVFFNGENIAVLNSSYADMKVIEIPRKLWKKDNKLTVKAYDSGIVPAGVLAEIRITGKDGKTTTIVSDSRWQCNGKAADVIAKFGKGAWGNRVSYEISGEK